MAVAKKFNLKPKHINLIDKVIAQIEAHPDTNDMATWFANEELTWSKIEKLRGEKVFNCGTTCCIAGHTLVAARYPLKHTITGKEKKGLKYTGGVGEVAAKLLGLAPEDYSVSSEDKHRWGFPDVAGNLFRDDPWFTVFLVERWPEQFQVRYDNATTNKQRGKVMVARLRYLKKYGA